MKAIFCDLDNTLIRTISGERFPKDKHDWEFTRLVRYMVSNPLEEFGGIVIVTNQGGIERGYINASDVEDKIEKVVNDLNKRELNVIDWAYCPYMDKNNFNRKPNPGIAYHMALRHRIELGWSIMIGDREEDRLFAINSGIKDFYSPDEFCIDS